MITWKSRFSHDATESKVYILCIITIRSSVYHYAPKTLIFDAFFPLKIASNLHIWCNFKWKSRFYHDAPKMCIFHALLRGKAGVFMISQKTVYICYILTGRSRFSQDSQDKMYFCCFITLKSRFFSLAQKRVSNAVLCKKLPEMCIFHAVYVNKQVFSCHDRKTHDYLMHSYI